MTIDVTFDFRSDATTDDPDRSSPTLRRYHQLLWSKPLPSGHPFDLDTTTPSEYLHHSSDLGEYFLSSDSVIPTYDYWESTADLISQLPASEVEDFVAVGYTIGGMMVFPSNMVARKSTINMARGMTRSIADRMDLTLECIRRYYAGDSNTPLGAVLARYNRFFALFGSFRGYLDCFLLQDLVDEANDSMRFFMDFDNFRSPAVPGDVATYERYRQASIEFVLARNERICRWASENLGR